jgi:hypothetical protein
MNKSMRWAWRNYYQLTKLPEMMLLPLKSRPALNIASKKNHMNQNQALEKGNVYWRSTGPNKVHDIRSLKWHSNNTFNMLFWPGHGTSPLFKVFLCISYAIDFYYFCMMRLMPEPLQYPLFIGAILVTFFPLRKQYAKKRLKECSKTSPDTLSPYL